jgi:hypothetical protein
MEAVPANSAPASSDAEDNRPATLSPFI